MQNAKLDLKSLVVCLVASLFFLYEFIQINMFNSISQDVTRAFQLDATGLGLLSSCYFYSTVGFLLPAGQILDRFSPKNTILVTLLICVFGLVGFSRTDSFFLAAIFRFLEGIGSAFCFLGSFRIAAAWVSEKHLGFVTGLIITIGMLGGVLAQAPLQLLVKYFGWRDALLVDASLGILVALAILFIVKDAPRHLIGVRKLEYWASLKTVYLNFHNWLCGFYTCILNLPLVLFGALWGNMYLEQVHHFSESQAAAIISLLFIGTIVGAPLAGLLSGKIGSRKIPMLFGALVSFLVASIIISLPSKSLLEFSVLFFLLGLFSSTQGLGYPAAAERNSPALAGMSASVVSFTTMSGYIVFQPLFGWIMDAFGKPTLVENTRVYSSFGFELALSIIPLSLILIAMVFTYFFRDQTSPPVFSTDRKV